MKNVVTIKKLSFCFILKNKRYWSTRSKVLIRKCYLDIAKPKYSDPELYTKLTIVVSAPFSFYISELLFIKKILVRKL